MLIPALRFLVLQQYLKENEGSLTTILCVPGIYTFPGFSWCSAPHCARYTPTRTVRPPWRPCAASAFRSSRTVQDATGGAGAETAAAVPRQAEVCTLASTERTRGSGRRGEALDGRRGAEWRRRGRRGGSTNFSSPTVLRKRYRRFLLLSKVHLTTLGYTTLIYCGQ